MYYTTSEMVNVRFWGKRELFFMMNHTQKTNGKWDIRPNPSGNGLNICVIEEKGIFYFGINIIRKLVRIPLLFLRRQT